MRIAKNVEMLELSGVGRIYPALAWDENSLVLFDTGYPGQTDLIVKAISDAGFSADRLTHIILTHQDMDHIGCVMDLVNLAPSVIIMAHADETPYIEGKKFPAKLAAAGDYDKLSDERKAWFDRTRDYFKTISINVGQTLADGEILPLLGGVEVIHTPGHTPGHICLFLRKSGILIGGDGVKVTDGKPAGPAPAHTIDMELGIRSMEKAMARDVKGLVGYHDGYLKLGE